MTAAEGETTTIQDSALQQLDKSLNGVITEFVGTAEFTGKAVRISLLPKCSEANVIVAVPFNRATLIEIHHSQLTVQH